MSESDLTGNAVTTSTSIAGGNESNERRKAFGWIRIACTATSSLCFFLGLRAAWREGRNESPLTRRQLFSGMGVATRALAIATLISVSGYALAVLVITWAMGVSTPKEFGNAMRGAFGNRLRLAGSEKSQSFEEIFKDERS